jgi:glutamate formiminotransferase / 5-formyltetrahydrofolate cyclo-ligase
MRLFGVRPVLGCVVNVSEGRRGPVMDGIATAAGRALLDVHADPHHHRMVLTLVGEEAPRAVATAAVSRLDLRDHAGVHPRIGVVDVVPFVPWNGAPLADAVAARDRFARWIATELGVPAFCYGPERALPEVRREAFRGLSPDAGPLAPHPTAGAVAVGARPPLVAWNVVLAEPDLGLAQRIAVAIRGPNLRALGLQVGDEVQVSMNLIAPEVLGPDRAWDLVAAQAPVDRAELVGLIHRSVLDRIPPERWPELDLAADRTVEARLGQLAL